MAKPNLNALNGLFLWGILSPSQLALLTGVSLSLCSRQLHNLANVGLATDLGRTSLPPSDILYGRYFRVASSQKVRNLVGSSPYPLGRGRGRIGADKLVSFRCGLVVPRHSLFSVQCAAWILDFLAKKFPEKRAVGFPESYLRRKLGWHHHMGPARSVSNPKFTMVPDSLVIFDGQELKIEAEVTPKSPKAYKELFFAARPADDSIFYIYPDTQTMKKVVPMIPDGYRVSHCVFGDEQALLSSLFRLFPSLSAR